MADAIMKNLRIFFFSGLPMLAVFIVQLCIQYNPYGDLYMSWPPLDIPMHFLGGFATAWSLQRLYWKYAKTGGLMIRPPLLFFLCLVSLSALVGVAWEGYEYIHDLLYPLHHFQPSVADTMGDLALDVVGGAVFAILSLFFGRKK